MAVLAPMATAANTTDRPILSTNSACLPPRLDRSATGPPRSVPLVYRRMRWFSHSHGFKHEQCASIFHEFAVLRTYVHHAPVLLGVDGGEKLHDLNQA